MIDHLLDIVAPHSCCGCGNLGSILCPQCKNDIDSEPFEQCLLCLSPTSVTNLCDRCHRTGCYDDAWCVGARDRQLKRLLDRYKFDAARQAGRVAADLLHARLPLLPPEVVVVPVPTAPAHQRVRGFDHTAVIARRFAQLHGLQYAQVLRSDRSDTQHFKTKAERQRSATDKYRVISKVPPRILLVDDIYTTGSTASACSRLLREHGAESILLAIIARQTLDGNVDL